MSFIFLSQFFQGSITLLFLHPAYFIVSITSLDLLFPSSPSISHFNPFPFCSNPLMYYSYLLKSSGNSTNFSPVPHRAGTKPAPKSGGFIGRLVESPGNRGLVNKLGWIKSYGAHKTMFLSPTAQTHLPDMLPTPAPRPRQIPYIRGCKQSPGPGADSNGCLQNLPACQKTATIPLHPALGYRF